MPFKSLAEAVQVIGEAEATRLVNENVSYGFHLKVVKEWLVEHKESPEADIFDAAESTGDQDFVTRIVEALLERILNKEA